LGPSFPIGLNYLHTFNENIFAEIRLGYLRSYWEQYPEQGRDVPQHYDYLTGMYSGNMGGWFWNLSAQLNVSATLTQHAEDFLKGSHDFKIGVECMRGKDNFESDYSGGFTYTDNYPYSRAKGNMFNSVGAAWGGTYFENPNRQINAYGNMNNDAPHALDVYGTFPLPLGLTFSPRFTWLTGRNYGKASSVCDPLYLRVGARYYF